MRLGQASAEGMKGLQDLFCAKKQALFAQAGGELGIGGRHGVSV